MLTDPVHESGSQSKNEKMGLKADDPLEDVKHAEAELTYGWDGEHSKTEFDGSRTVITSDKGTRYAY
jgi:hypothetical protein